MELSLAPSAPKLTATSNAATNGDPNEVWSIERLAAMMFGTGAVPLIARAGYFGLYEPCFIGMQD